MTPLLQYTVVAMVARFLYRILKMGLLLLWRRPLAVRTEQDVALYLETKRAYDTEYSRHRINQLLPSTSVVVVLIGILFLHHLAEPLPTNATVLAEQRTTRESPVIDTVVPPEVVPRSAPRASPATTLGVAVHDCLLPLPPTETYCYHTDLVWRGPVRDTRVVRGCDQPSEHRPHFVDHNGDHYFRVHASVVRPIDAALDENATHVVASPVLVKEKLLRQSLARRYEHDGEHCVCPEQLGLHDSLAFLLYEEATHASRHWTIMIDPLIVGPAPGATRVHTTAAAAAAAAAVQTLEHYDKLIVSFAAPQLQMEAEESARLIEYNNRLQDVFIVRRIGATEIGRISIVLSGQDASCFIYCQHSLPRCPPLV